MYQVRKGCLGLSCSLACPKMQNFTQFLLHWALVSQKMTTSLSISTQTHPFPFPDPSHPAPQGPQVLKPPHILGSSPRKVFLSPASVWVLILWPAGSPHHWKTRVFSFLLWPPEWSTLIQSSTLPPVPCSTQLPPPMLPAWGAEGRVAPALLLPALLSLSPLWLSPQIPLLRCLLSLRPSPPSQLLIFPLSPDLLRMHYATYWTKSLLPPLCPHIPARPPFHAVQTAIAPLSKKPEEFY